MPVKGKAHTYGPWVAGVNFMAPAEEVHPQEIYDEQNVEIGTGGEAKKRKGSTPYITTALTGTPTLVACGDQEFSASSSAIFCVAGGKFYEDVSGTWTDRTSTATITDADDNTWSFANANGTLIGHDGVSGDTILKWAAAGGNVAALDVDSRFTWAKWWAWWDGRAWAANSSAGTDQVNYSDSADIETWGASNFYLLGADCTGIAPLGDAALAIHAKDRIQLLTPTRVAANPYGRYGRASKGSVSGRAIATVTGPDNKTIQLFPCRDGIYQFDGGESVKISWKLDGPRYWDNINKDRLSQSFCIVYPDKNCVWFYLPYGSSQTNMNHIMVYDYIRRLWYGPYVNGTTLERNCGALISDIPYAGGYDGYLYKHETAYVDNDGTTDNAIDAWFETSAMAPGGIDFAVRWLYARISYVAEGAWGVEVTQKSEDIASNASTFTQEGGYDAIGTTFQIGVSAIAGSQLSSTQDVKLYGYSPHSQLKFRNANASERFNIHPVAQVFRPIGRTRKIRPRSAA